jgi:hypothetical protein
MILSLVKDALPANADPPSPYYRHPEYVVRWWWREFNRLSYVGGREYARPARLTIEFDYPLPYSRDASGILITRNAQGQPIDPGRGSNNYPSLLYRHSREKEWEFYNRLRRAHYFNIVKTAVNMLVSHAFKKGVTRTSTDKTLSDFWDACDYDRKQKIDVFMREGARMAAVEGMMWCAADVKTTDPKDGSAGDGKPYVYWVNPLDIFDWLIDDDGQIVWLKQFVYVEGTRTPKEGIKPIHRFRVWYKDRVEEFDIEPGSGVMDPPVTVKKHGFGRVPFEPLYSTKNNESAFPDGEPLVSDLAKVANSIYQYNSLLDEILYKQTFSQLVVPDTNVDAVQIGTNTVFGYNPVNGGKPEYIAPDPRQAQVIGEVIANKLEQARLSFGVGRGVSESSKQKSSGDALTIETEDKRSILADVAASASDFENRLVGLLGALRNVKPDDQEATIEYPTEFDTTAFVEDINEALDLRKVGMSPEIMLALRRQLAARKLAPLPEKERQKLLDTLQLEPVALELAAAEVGIGESVRETGIAPATTGAAPPGAAPPGVKVPVAAPPAAAQPPPPAPARPPQK